MKSETISISDTLMDRLTDYSELRRFVRIAVQFLVLSTLGRVTETWQNLSLHIYCSLENLVDDLSWMLHTHIRLHRDRNLVLSDYAIFQKLAMMCQSLIFDDLDPDGTNGNKNKNQKKSKIKNDYLAKYLNIPLMTERLYSEWIKNTYKSFDYDIINDAKVTFLSTAELLFKLNAKSEKVVYVIHLIPGVNGTDSACFCTYTYADSNYASHYQWHTLGTGWYIDEMQVMPEYDIYVTREIIPGTTIKGSVRSITATISLSHNLAYSNTIKTKNLYSESRWWGYYDMYFGGIFLLVPGGILLHVHGGHEELDKITLELDFVDKKKHAQVKRLMSPLEILFFSRMNEFSLEFLREIRRNACLYIKKHNSCDNWWHSSVDTDSITVDILWVYSMLGDYWIKREKDNAVQQFDFGLFKTMSNREENLYNSLMREMSFEQIWTLEQSHNQGECCEENPLNSISVKIGTSLRMASKEKQALAYDLGGGTFDVAFVAPCISNLNNWGAISDSLLSWVYSTLDDYWIKPKQDNTVDQLGFGLFETMFNREEKPNNSLVRIMNSQRVKTSEHNRNQYECFVSNFLNTVSVKACAGLRMVGKEAHALVYDLGGGNLLRRAFPLRLKNAGNSNWVTQGWDASNATQEFLFQISVATATNKQKHPIQAHVVRQSAVGKHLGTRLLSPVFLA